jgi:hypothetical protein
MGSQREPAHSEESTTRSDDVTSRFASESPSPLMMRGLVSGRGFIPLPDGGHFHVVRNGGNRSLQSTVNSQGVFDSFRISGDRRHSAAPKARKPLGSVVRRCVLCAEILPLPISSRKRAVWSQWDHLGENIVLGGPDWRQTGILCLATIQTASKKVHGRREFLV